MLDEKLRLKTFHLTGHRPNALGGYNKNSEENKWLLDEARRLFTMLEAMGFKRMITGMALGWDQWGLDLAIYFGFYNIAAIPCLNQEKRWPEESQKEYHRLLKACNEVHSVSDQKYDRSCMQERNMWMVDRSVITLAVYNGGSGGTYNCLAYARRRENLIYCIDSKRREVYMIWGDKRLNLPR